MVPAERAGVAVTKQKDEDHRGGERKVDPDGRNDKLGQLQPMLFQQRNER